MPRAPNPWKSVKRDFFPFRQVFPTRWADNDQYGHANNSIYHFWQDTVINHYLLQQRVLSLPQSMTKKQQERVFASCRDSVGICSENGFQYFASVGYPQDIECGLCVTHIGRVAVTYRVGVFVADVKEGKSKNKKSQETESNFHFGGGTIVMPPGSRDDLISSSTDDDEDVDDGSIKAIGHFVHVFTYRETQRPLKKMPEELHDALKLLLVEEPKNHH